MGLQAQPDHAVQMGALVHLLNLIKVDAQCAEDVGFVSDANYLWKMGAYLCVLSAASLRGHKVLYVERAGLRKYLSKGKNGSIPVGLVIMTEVVLSEAVCSNLPHVTVALLGHFKGETKADHHLIAIESETQSGLQPIWWIEKLVMVCPSEGHMHGPAFADEYGQLA